ncbi:concanavalin A-like lectin/glucanase domain-containing protein [Gigaspora rosea]|uniref:Concanavalin A-like lectin/glucanase domain-containing protein n=1 Tax=Gigaspora rosea TaxID=44941 RepID=A0A397VTA0_9GLOM|nr:concanavalin A-like lectin/glucanase domain-containing protein [Gigaspora rosea]
MTSITWNVNDKSTLLNVDLNKLEVNYTGRGEDNDAVIRTNNPIPLQCKLFYFEIDITNDGKNEDEEDEEDGIIAIGFCTKLAELNKLPGCGKNSWGYHSDDGNFFDCSELEEPYGSTFKTSDTIGCCLNFRNNTVLYTKNGVNLGREIAKYRNRI